MATPLRPDAGRGEFAPRIFAVGDAAVMLELGDRVDLAINAIAQRAAEEVRSAALPGVTDVIPAIATVTVHFDASLGASAGELRKSVTELLGTAYARSAAHVDEGERRRVEIPVCYEEAFAPDLAEIAGATGLAVDEVVRRHVASGHRVLMMGFAPGFPYIGGLDPTLGVPRRATPRPRVEAGSVAIAAGQTAIYPFATPGGWNVIGRTPLRLFDPGRDPASLLQAGDEVAFVPIAAAEFAKLAREPAPA